MIMTIEEASKELAGQWLPAPKLMPQGWPENIEAVTDEFRLSVLRAVSVEQFKADLLRLVSSGKINARSPTGSCLATQNEPTESTLVNAVEAKAELEAEGVKFQQAESVASGAPESDEPPAPALMKFPCHADRYQAGWPLCTKQEIIDGFLLTGKDWNDLLSRPNKYKEAVKQAGKKGAGGDTLLSPIVFASLLVKFKDLTEGQVRARFLKVAEWKQWEAEMIAEIGAI